MCVCITACVCEQHECQTTANPAALHVGGYFLLCCVISLLSAAALQVTHAHNEQWHHTSNGCLATSIAQPGCAEREADRNLGKEQKLWGASVH